MTSDQQRTDHKTIFSRDFCRTLPSINLQTVVKCKEASKEASEFARSRARSLFCLPAVELCGLARNKSVIILPPPLTASANDLREAFHLPVPCCFITGTAVRPFQISKRERERERVCVCVCLRLCQSQERGLSLSIH